MPEIPTFVANQSYGSGVPSGGLIPIGTGAGEGNSLADGMNRVATHFAHVHAQMQHQADTVEASKASGGVEMEAAELSLKYANDPDPSTAPQRFRAELTQLHQKTISGLQSPRVRQIVEERLSRSGPVAYVHMLQQSAAQQRDIARATQLETISTQSKALSAAPDGATQELAVQGIISANAAGVASGAFSRDFGRNAASKGIAEAAISLGQTDPVAAQAMALKYKGHIDSTHWGQIENALRGPLIKREGMGAAQRELYGGDGGNEGAALRQTAERLGVDPVDLATIVSYETGGKMSPSIRGGKNNQHIGLIQFGANEQKEFGASETQSFQEQLGAVERYMTARGLKPGDSLETMYRIINGGNRNAPLTASDGNDTIAGHVGKMQTGVHRERAQRFVGGESRVRPGPMSEADIEQGRTNLMRDYAGKPEVADAALSEYNKMVSQHQGRFRAAQQQFAREYADGITKLENGEDAPELSPQKIMAILPPDIAADKLNEIAIAREAGQAYAGIRTGSPQDIMATRERLTPTAGSDNYAQRLRVLETFDKKVEAHSKSLIGPTSDAAAVANRSPVVQQQAAAMQAAGKDTPEGRTARERYLDTSLSEQLRMGVPRDQTRVLSNDQVSFHVAQWTKQGPEDAKVGELIQGMQAEYGSYWRQAFQELVHKGKLPPEYQVLASMQPGQGRSEMQAALMILKTKGSIEKMEADLLPKNVTRADVDKALADNFNQSRVAFGANGEAGAEFHRHMEVAARAMAYRDIGAGMTVPDAVAKASKALLTDRWEFSGTMMYPKGEGGNVRASTRAVTAGLTPAMLDMSQIPASAAPTQAGREAVWMDAVRNGEWVPNANADGLVLTVKYHNGARIDVRMSDANRTPVEIKFDRLPKAGSGLFGFGAAPSGAGPAERVVPPIGMRTYDVPGQP